MGIPFDQAREIQLAERDGGLALDAREWPNEASSLSTWTSDRQAGSFRRRIGSDSEKDFATPLKERMLRFPSAPIHGLQRLSQDQVNMGPVETFHTLRLLSHPKRRGKVSRIFLMHNGLNEIGRMTLYYQLASFLIDEDPGTVCILRPFPGHLTRCASPGLTETPLDHYLWDGLHLFRQFLRYMIETRWLLSTLARYSSYRCIAGSGLLCEKSYLPESRLKTLHLAREMRAEWTDLREASKAVIDNHRNGSPKMPAVPQQSSFEQVIDSLRDALTLDAYPERDGSAFYLRSEPELHAIGYSLGGFTAQSVFMSWPFLVSSCSTLLSGGAMRELAPTAFADPEEWQTVLHSLRYELDDAMRDWRFNEEGHLAGIPPNLFLYLKRAFYEIFQQEYRGSFQTRLVSFRQRMLFVVGGDDPIVRPQSVLDSGPPDGVNMLTVGGLGHFLGLSPASKVEQEQRSFWMPEVAKLIGRLAKNAATKHQRDLRATWLDENELLPLSYGQKKGGENTALEPLSIAERLEVERGSLPNQIFQRSLDDLLARADEEVNEDHKGRPGSNSSDAEDKRGKGLLFVLKNELPTFLLDERSLQLHAAALYHEDVGAANYIAEVRSRRPILERRRDRICTVIPWNAETVMRQIDAGFQHPSQSEGSGEQVASDRAMDHAWSQLMDRCAEWTAGDYEHAIQVFDGRNRIEQTDDLDTSALFAVARDRLGIAESKKPISVALPDCWIWMSNEFFGRAYDNPPTIEGSRQAICEKVPIYVEKSKKAEQRIAELLRTTDLRMVTVSRARYNPRFRGRIVAEPRQAQELLLQVALSIIASKPFKGFPF